MNVKMEGSRPRFTNEISDQLPSTAGKISYIPSTVREISYKSSDKLLAIGNEFCSLRLFFFENHIFTRGTDGFN